MSAEAVQSALNHEATSGPRRMLLFVYAWHARDDGVIPTQFSNEIISREAGLSRTAFFRGQRALQESGVLKKTGYDAKGKPIFRLNFPEVSQSRKWDSSPENGTVKNGTPVPKMGPTSPENGTPDLYIDNNMDKKSGKAAPPPLPADPLEPYPELNEAFQVAMDAMAGKFPYDRNRPLAGTRKFFEWRGELEKLVRLDGYEPGQVADCLIWLSTEYEPDRSGFDWREQVRSIPALRKCKGGEPSKFAKIFTQFEKATENKIFSHPNGTERKKDELFGAF